MQKVYLLLRENQQTGPHSLEELAQLQLKNSDLIWIEGKSAGWYYPHEVDALKPLLATPAAQKERTEAVSIQTPTHPAPPPNTGTTPKKVYVSLPENGKLKAIEKPPKAVTEKMQDVDYIEQRAEQLRRKVQSYPSLNEKK
jgi:hypothetical protein